MEVTATEAKNRFGQMLDEAQREPVFIGKSGRRRGVLLSPTHYAALLAAAGQPAEEEPMPKTAEAFYVRYKEWIDEMNAHVEKSGLWNDDLRVW
jgi:prevent-host-death family protein